MSVQTKYKTVAFAVSFFFLTLFFCCLLKPADAASVSERRKLQQFPELSAQTLASGKFVQEFETYTLDQFPGRDRLRALKAAAAFYALGQKDNHGIYVVDGHAAKMEYPMKEAEINRAMERFSYVYETCLANTDVNLYLSVIPDKNYFLAAPNGYLSMDYNAFYERVKEKKGDMEFIDIASLLTIDDYYRTDPHWRQERLEKVAKELAEKMGAVWSGVYEEHTLERPFYGAWYGQSALALAPEKMSYLTNDSLRQCVVYDYQNGKERQIYDMEKAEGKDMYEMFLSGSLSLVEIRNPAAASKQELILFRDSFGSSLAPLLAESYAKITLVDLRYIHPDLLKNYLKFDHQDVLFLYSVPVLNNGSAIK